MKSITRRSAAAALGLLVATGTLLAEASDCYSSVIGNQTGNTYTLIGQSEVTVTVNAGVSAGIEAGGEYQETFNKGYYRGEDGKTYTLNCSTMTFM